MANNYRKYQVKCLNARCKIIIKHQSGMRVRGLAYIV